MKHDSDKDQNLEPQGDDEIRISLFFLLFPRFTFMAIFTQILLCAAVSVWLGGALFFNSPEAFIENYMLVYFSAGFQIAVVSFFLVKTVRYEKKYRTYLSNSALLYSFIFLALAVRTIALGEPGVLWHLAWAVVSAWAWYFYQSTMMGRLLDSIALRYQIIHGSNPYEDLARYKMRKKKKK